MSSLSKMRRRGSTRRRGASVRPAAGVLLVVLLAGCGDREAAAPPTGPVAPGETPVPAAPLAKSAEPAAGAAAVPDVPPPKMVFDEMFHDLGTGFTRERLEHRYRFRNTGGRDLVIHRLRPSCTACTVVDYSRDPVPPGGEGFVRVSLTSATPGKSRKYVDVYTNADNGTSATARLTVQAVFRERVWVKPSTVELGAIRQGMRFPEKQVKVSWLRDHPIEIREIEVSPPDQVTVTSTPFEEKERAGVRLDLHFGDPQMLLAAGNGSHVYGSVVLHTEDPVYSDLAIRFTGEVREDVVVLPRRILFVRKEDGGMDPREVKLAAAPNGSLSVESLECSLPFLEASVREITPGVLYAIRLAPSAPVPPGRHEGQLVLHTNYERQPEFLIPVVVPE